MVDTVVVAETGDEMESRRSAVSWAAVIAGGVTAAAASICLLLLGAGWGLSVVSPWSGQGTSLATIGVGAAIWLVVTQWVSAGLGGYLTGRLRTSWSGVHSDEVFFRDTAHGFLAWALATVVTVGLLASASSALVGKSVDSAATVAAGAAQGAAQGASPSPLAYYSDMLFRPNAASAPPSGSPAVGVPAASPQDVRAESGRILATVTANGDIAPDDKAYLAQMISTQTGLSPDDAAKRVDTVVAQVKDVAAKAKDAADKARSAAAKLALLSFVALLIGAFIASVAAAFGGNERDENERLYAVV
jgi:hypothetical protein